MVAALSMVLVTSCVRTLENGRPAKSSKSTPSPAKKKPASTPAAPKTNAPVAAVPAPTPAPTVVASTPPVADDAPAVPPPEPSPDPPKVVYSALYDAEFKEIFALAKKGRWEEAETMVNALFARDPQNPAIERVRGWVVKESSKLRDQALEDEIRQIDAKNSVFNPTIKDMITERKDRGLPPRKDIRDVVDQIQATPYIPPNYGKTNYAADRGIMFDFESRQGRMAKVLEKEVSIHLDNATLESIIFTLGQQEGINFVADRALPAFQQKLSVNFQRVKLANFLKYISRNMDLQFQVGEDLVWVVDSKDPKKVLEETRIYRLKRGFVLPAEFGPPEVQKTEMRQNNIVTVTEVQKLNKFVNDLSPELPAIQRAITNFFTGSKWFIDYERNIILAKGTPDQLEVMEKIIEEFDKAIQQVLIEAKFITISEGEFLRLGAVWGTQPAGGTIEAPVDQTGLAFLGTAPGFSYTFTNVFGVSQLTALLTAIEQSGESQVLSAPRLTLINNLPATISDGKVQYYYEEYQVKTQILEARSSSQLVPSGKPTKITSGASLEVLASIGGDGKTILLALHPKVNSDVQLKPYLTITDIDPTGRIVSSSDIKLPEYRTQDLSTRVVVRSGQTVAMGGVLERTQTKYIESIPVLGNLPVIGAAFRRRTEVDRPRYLLVFVTATIISDAGEYMVYTDPDEPPSRKPAPDAKFPAR